MNATELEARVANLEAIVAELQKKIENSIEEEVPWWKKIVGTFADDEAHEEAMRLGREYRESLRPKFEDEK